MQFSLQVQLLISTKDRENYTTIKDSLDKLRLLVEKSELWVYKSKKKSDGKKNEITKRKKSTGKDQSKKDDAKRESTADNGKSMVCFCLYLQHSKQKCYFYVLSDYYKIQMYRLRLPSDESSGENATEDISLLTNYKIIKDVCSSITILDFNGRNQYNVRTVILLQILQHLCELCVTISRGVTKNNKHEQRLLRNMGAHTAVIELLQIPHEKVTDVENGCRSIYTIHQLSMI